MNAKTISWRRLRYHWDVYLFIVPTVVLVGTFAYVPATSGLVHSLYTWNGAEIQEFIGLQNYMDLLADTRFWTSFRTALLLGLANVCKMLPAMAVAVCIHRCRAEWSQYLYRVLFVIPMVIPGVVIVLLWKFFFEPTTGILNTTLRATGLLDLLCWIDRLAGLGVFRPTVNPAWLGDPSLAFASLVLWGFPWVGSFAVLTYLASLGAIGSDVYDAADMDGANAWHKFAHIELPLMLSMVRINLVFVILATLQDAGLVLLLFGDSGGPGGVVQVPAVFMFREAFSMQHMGYACAIGVVLTLIVFGLSKINEWLVRITK